MTLVIEVSCTSSRDTKRLELEDGKSLEIGRSNEELHLFNDARLSRRHFEIRYADGKIEITHLSRTNPTLVASDGSTEFKKVEGTRTENGSCRIIAGSHRFVLIVEKTDSVLEQTMSGGEPHGFWSDVDGDSKDSVVAVDSEPTPAGRASPTIQDHQPPKAQPERPKSDFFDVEDAPTEKKTSQSAPKSTKSPKSRTKKPFFPVADDFFDD